MGLLHLVSTLLLGTCGLNSGKHWLSLSPLTSRLRWQLEMLEKICRTLSNITGQRLAFNDLVMR